MSIPRNPHSMAVGSAPMFKLSLQSIAPGVFSSERLVAFIDASGEEQYALVDASFVNEGEHPWLEVRARVDGPIALIALPTDGTRIRVAADRVQELA
jgi:hypothetical protein